MASIIIQTNDPENLNLITTLAKKLGVNVSDVTDEQLEDIGLGNIMTGSKTGKFVSRNSVMKKLN